MSNIISAKFGLNLTIIVKVIDYFSFLFETHLLMRTITLWQQQSERVKEKLHTLIPVLSGNLVTLMVECSTADPKVVKLNTDFCDIWIWFSQSTQCARVLVTPKKQFNQTLLYFTVCNSTNWPNYWGYPMYYFLIQNQIVKAIHNTIYVFNNNLWSYSAILVTKVLPSYGPVYNEKWYFRLCMLYTVIIWLLQNLLIY